MLRYVEVGTLGATLSTYCSHFFSRGTHKRLLSFFFIFDGARAGGRIEQLGRWMWMVERNDRGTRPGHWGVAQGMG